MKNLIIDHKDELIAVLQNSAKKCSIVIDKFTESDMDCVYDMVESGYWEGMPEENFDHKVIGYLNSIQKKITDILDDIQNTDVLTSPMLVASLADVITHAASIMSVIKGTIDYYYYAVDGMVIMLHEMVTCICENIINIEDSAIVWDLNRASTSLFNLYKTYLTLIKERAAQNYEEWLTEEIDEKISTLLSEVESNLTTNMESAHEKYLSMVRLKEESEFLSDHSNVNALFDMMDEFIKIELTWPNPHGEVVA